jgi:hypothetical protein
MNGGTNIATAIQRAGQLLKNPYGDAEDGTTGDDTGPAGDTIDSEDCAGKPYEILILIKHVQLEAARLNAIQALRIYGWIQMCMQNVFVITSG